MYIGQSLLGSAILVTGGKTVITTENAALLLIDVQEKLLRVMHDQAGLLENIKKMVKGAQILELPVLWTEQNPAGLGPTVPEIAEHLPDKKPVSKFSFSCCGNEPFIADLKALNRKNILVAGIEAHVCVYQTVVDLLNLQFDVEIVADAVASRTPENRTIGLQKSKAAGAGITSVETVLFELLKEAKGDRFKQISKLVK
jgi:nicotinamidase-related amidase